MCYLIRMTSEDELRVAANDNVSVRDVVEHIDQRRARDTRDALFDDIDLVVIAPWGPPVLDTVASWARAHCPTARIIDTAALGATLAASPALAWIAAIDLLSAGTHRRALVLDAGVDGDVGAVLLRGGER